MDFLKYGGIILIIISTLVILLFAIRSKKFIKTLALNAFLGISTFAIINLTTVISGVGIPINWWTVGGSAIYGIPAVCGFLILPLIFN